MRCELNLLSNMKKKTLPIQTSYLQKIYRTDQFIKTVKLAATKIRKFRRKVKFDAIAFTGSSGAGLAYPLSYILGIPLICVRKTPSNSHYRIRLEGCVAAGRYIIVDDFIESGRTIDSIRRAIKSKNTAADCVGIYLYNDGAITPRDYKNIKVI